MKVWDRVKFRSITTAGAPLLQLEQPPILKEAEKEEKPLELIVLETLVLRSSILLNIENNTHGFHSQDTLGLVGRYHQSDTIRQLSSCAAVKFLKNEQPLRFWLLLPSE